MMKTGIAFALSLVTLTSLQACSSAPVAPGGGDASGGAMRARVREGLSRLFSEPFTDTRAVDVTYATNRELTGSEPGCSDQAFGVKEGQQTRFGTCKVNVPKRHPVGKIDADPNPRADSHRFFRMMSHQALDEAAFTKVIHEAGEKGVLVFVHGFNVRFEEAVNRAAQIAYDLKFQGRVLVLTWPAGSAGGGFLESTRVARTYDANKLSAAASVNPFASLLRILRDRPDGVPAYLLVHSMGHQVVLPALAQVAPESDKSFVDELILNAPDFSTDDFQKLAPFARKTSRRITLYCSFEDNAIAASERYNSGRRLGACDRVDGVDVVNVGEIDPPTWGVGGLGHGYYASRSVLTDVFQVILGIEADRRLFVRVSEPNSVENFYLRP